MKKILVMMMLLLPMAVMAQEEKDTTVAIPQTEQEIQLAAELSKYGYANNDALSLIEAARLAKRAGLAEEARTKDNTSGTEAAKNSEGKKGQVSLDATKLLADAKQKAGNDDVLLALIDDVSKEGTRGAGNKYAVDAVDAYDTDYYHIRFYGGSTATVIVIGDGDTDLDLYVYNSNGTLVAKDDDYSDNCVCTWYPRYTGTYTIKIVNRGSVYNRYVLRTN